MPLLSWPAALLLIVLLTAALTWLARIYALRRNLLDHPGERRSHVVTTPRGGGVAIVLSSLAALLLAALLWPSQALVAGVFAFGLVLVAGIGWWDDHRPLPALTRLAVHALAALLVAGLVWRAGGDPLQAALSWLLTISLINIWNFMDGINGLAASQAALAALAFAAALPAPWSLAALVLAAACLGFLPFNFPRARIFLGDVGSGALGYLLAGVLALSSVVTQVNWLLLLLPLAAFLVDAGLTLVRRVITGQKWMQPHTQHLYQRLTKCGLSHAAVTFGYAVYTLAGITLAALVYSQPALLAAACAIIWLILSAMAWFVLGKRIGIP